MPRSEKGGALRRAGFGSLRAGSWRSRFEFAQQGHGAKCSSALVVPHLAGPKSAGPGLQLALVTLKDEVLGSLRVVIEAERDCRPFDVCRLFERADRSIDKEVKSLPGGERLGRHVDVLRNLSHRV